MKKSKKGLIAIIVMLLVILLILGGYVYSKTDLFKSSETLFYKYALQNLELYPEVKYDDMLQNIKEIQEKDYIASGDLKIKIDGDSEEVESMKAIEDLKLDYKTVKVGQNTESEINLNYSDKELLKISTKEETEKYGIKIDGIYDKYIAIENKDLDELFKKLEMESDEIPDKLETIDVYDLLYISQEDRNTIKQTYKDTLKNTITKDKFVAEKNVEIEVNNSNIKANAYKLKLTEKELLEMMKQILETLKNDELLLNLIESKIEKLNIKEAEDIKEDLKESIEESLNEIKLDIEDAEENNYLEIIVYESKGNTVKTELKVYTDGEEEAKMVLDLQKQDDKTTGELSMIEYDDEIMTFEITKVEKEEKDSKKLEYEISMEVEGEEIAIICKTETNGNGNKTEMSFGNDEVKLGFESNQKVEYKSENIEKMNDENTIILNDKTQEELMKIFEELSNNAEKLLSEKVQLLGIDPTMITGTNSQSVQADADVKLYMDLMQKYQNGEITEEQLNNELQKLEL